MMRHIYNIFIDEVEDNTIDELYALMSKQARISTRRQSHDFEITLSAYNMTTGFRSKRDRDDFERSFEKSNREFLEKHGFIEARPSPPRFNWNGYTDRLMNPPHRQ